MERAKATSSCYAVDSVVDVVAVDDKDFARSRHTGMTVAVRAEDHLATGLADFGSVHEDLDRDQAKDQKVVGLVVRQIRGEPDTAG